MEINGTLFNCELEDILIELNVQLGVFDKRRDSGKNIMVCCPYHQERRPSAGIRKSDGLFHCFACQEIHSLPELISFCFGKRNDIVGAFGWQWLNKHFLSLAVEDRKNVKLNFTRPIGQSVSNRNNISDSDGDRQKFVSEEELDSYRYTHPYWTERGIINDSIIELFDLGYSSKERMITFPNFDRYGHCLFVAKRSIDKKFFHYPSDVTKHVYGIYQLYKLKEFPKEVYITESMIDCLLLWQYDKYACALNGLGNSVQFRELTEMPCRKFILATDNDKAGLEARKRIKQNVRGKLFTEIMLPAMKKDIGECTESEIKHLIEVF